VKLDGIEPNLQTIADFSYPVARPLYFYVKNAHRGVIPNLQEMIEEYISDAALAPGGYLTERGLVPLPDEQRAKMQADVAAGVSMAAPAK
jgi:phosphate transport system substrate-binding protein